MELNNLTDKEILDIVENHQEAYLNKITLSITDECPLKCAHCIVDAKLTKIYEKKVDWVTILKAWNKRLKINKLSITGGEPFYAKKELGNISEYCKKYSIRLGVISSGYWALSAEKSIDILSTYEGITHISLSTDIYHQKYVSLKSIAYAYSAAKKLGKTCTIKITGESKESIDKNGIYKILFESIDSEDDVGYQKLIKLGRASELSSTLNINKVSRKVCLSSAPVIRSNGNVVPCCNDIITIDNETILNSGNIFKNTTEMIIEKLQTNWLLHYLRLWGFKSLSIEPEVNFSLRQDLFALSNKDICEACYKVCCDDLLSQRIHKLFDSLRLKFKVAMGLYIIFGDIRPLKILMNINSTIDKNR